MNGDAHAGGILVLLSIAGFFVYFLPAIVAAARRHQNANAVMILNLFLGWTFLGWVVAMIWAWTAVDPAQYPRATVICPHCAEPVLSAAVRCRYCGGALSPMTPYASSQRWPAISRSSSLTAALVLSGLMLVVLVAFHEHQPGSSEVQAPPAVPAGTVAPGPTDTPAETAPNASTVADTATLAKGDGPSFDCSKVTNPTAVAICGNVDLSQLDRQMATLYYATNYATDANTRAQQRRWIKQRNATCGAGVDCLRTQLSERIKQLQQPGAAPARPTLSATALDGRMASIRSMNEMQFDEQFRCPESYATDPERAVALAESAVWLQSRSGRITQAGLEEFRIKLLTRHNCAQTLRNIHDAAPTDGQAVPSASI